MRTLIQRTTRFLGAIASLCTLVLVLIITVDAGSRGLTGRAIPGVVEFGEILLVLIVYLSLGYTEQEGGHVRLELVARHLSPQFRAVAVTAGRVIVIAFLAWVTVKTFDAAVDSFQRDEYRFGLLRVRMWPARAGISLGFFMLTLETLISLVDGLRPLRSRQTSHPAGDA